MIVYLPNCKYTTLIKTIRNSILAKYSKLEQINAIGTEIYTYLKYDAILININTNALIELENKTNTQYMEF